MAGGRFVDAVDGRNGVDVLLLLLPDAAAAAAAVNINGAVAGSG